MRQPLYRYNPKTCQYERARLRPITAFLYAFSVVLTAVGMLAGLIIIHDFVFDSPKEIALRKENRALEKNFATLTRQLNTIEGSLQQLEQEDEKLHRKFFGSPLVKDEQTRPGVADQNMLLADASAFRAVLDDLKEKSSSLRVNAATTNYYFGEKINVGKNDIEFFNAMPTLQPVKHWDTESLISGFGTRINPFHKGLYEHPGIDIALPRGTEVIATAPGTITQAKKSNVQAGYGNYVEINHGHGFVTRYAHLDDLLVKPGQRVTKGQVIGTAGNTGGSVAPHLHYEVIRDNQHVDPVQYMIEGLESSAHHRMIQMSKKQNQSLD